MIACGSEEELVRRHLIMLCSTNLIIHAHIHCCSHSLMLITQKSVLHVIQPCFSNVLEHYRSSPFKRNIKLFSPSSRHSKWLRQERVLPLYFSGMQFRIFSFIWPILPTSYHPVSRNIFFGQTFHLLTIYKHKAIW